MNDLIPYNEPLRALSVIRKDYPLLRANSIIRMRPSFTLLDILVKTGHDIALVSQTRIFVNGVSIPKENWPSYIPAVGSEVVISVIPRGDVGRVLLSVVVMVAAIVAAVYTQQWWLLKFGEQAMTGALIAGGVAAVVVSTIGLLVINALIPPAVPKLPQSPHLLEQQDDSKSNFLTGSKNKYSPYEPIPRVYGKRRMVPPYAALPYTEVVGDEQYLRCVFLWGYGPLAISDIRIGETPITSYSGVTIEHRYGYPTDLPLTLYTKDIYEEAISIALVGWTPQIRTSQPNANSLSIDITFPNGLYSMDQFGYKQGYFVGIDIWYRKVGNPSWTYVTKLGVWSNKTTAVRRGYYWDVPEQAQYEVRLQKSQDDNYDTRVADDVEWTALRTITNVNPINCPVPVALTAIRIKASDQLHGTLDEFNAVVSSILPDWDTDTQTWIERETANPASAFRNAVQGSANTRPIVDGRVDLEQLQYWHEYCETEGKEINFIFDSKQSLFNVLTKIASTGRASPTVISSSTKWSVVIDEPQTTPIQHFGTDNSWDFQSEIVYPDLPHGFRCPFFNRNLNWEQDEITVYADTYNESNATKFETLELLGVTDADQIWKEARYHLACAILRRETYRFYADIEQIRCIRGDLIRCTHDVVLWGLGSGRVTNIETNMSGHVTAVGIDFYAEMVEGTDYGVRFRLKTGSTLVKYVLTDPVHRHNNPKGVRRLVFDTAILDPPFPEVGDLAMFGEKDKESKLLIVKSIIPQIDLSAQIICLDYDDAIYTADKGPIPEFDSYITIPTEWNTPIIDSIKSDGSVLFMDRNGNWQSRIVVNFYPVSTLAQKMFAIETAYCLYRSEGEGFLDETVFYDETWQYVTCTIAEFQSIIQPVQDKDTYKIKARYIKNNGSRGPWTEVYIHQVVGKTAPPSDITGFTVNQSSSLCTFQWNPVPDKDANWYEIRFGVPGEDNWESSLPLTQAEAGTAIISSQVPPGNWDFYIKAFDTSGNESENATLYNFTVANYYITILEDSHGPLWEGTLTNYIYNPNTGHLNPDDQEMADKDDFDIFNNYVVNPYTESIYQPPQIDMGVASTVRVWALIQGFFGPGVSGVKKPGSELYQDPDWILWSVGMIEEQTFDMRLKALSENGSFCVTNYVIYVDSLPAVETKEVNISVGGEQVYYDEVFLTAPALQVYAKPDGSNIRFPLVSGEDEDGFFVTVIDLTETDVGGTIVYTATKKGV